MFLGRGLVLGGGDRGLFLRGGSNAAIPTPTCYWKLDEVSGDAVDAISGMTLTDNNTVTTAAGVSAATGTSRQFTRANSECLTRTSEATLQVGDIDFTLIAWVYMDTKPSNMGIVCKRNPGTPSEYNLQYSASDYFVFNIFPNTSSPVGNVNTSSLGSPSTATWYMIACGHDAANDKVFISLNAGTQIEAATTGAPAGSVRPFEIGAQGGASFFDGRIDAVGLWKGVRLTQTQIAALYAGGQGKQYPFS